MTYKTIILGNDISISESKFIFSAGISRSTQLASLENLLEKHLEKNNNIPQLLLQGKGIAMPRQDILEHLGELFQLRALVNLNSEYIDLPDCCWSSERLENCFNLISRNLDVRPR